MSRLQDLVRYLSPAALRRTIDFQALVVEFPDGPGGPAAQDVREFIGDLVESLVAAHGVPAVAAQLTSGTARTAKAARALTDTASLREEALEQLESREAGGAERVYLRPASMYFEYLVDVPFFKLDYNPRVRDFEVDGDLREFQVDALRMMSGKINPSGAPSSAIFKTSFRLDWTWASYFAGITRVQHGAETYYCVHGYSGADPVILNNFYMTKDTRKAVSAAFRDSAQTLAPDWDKISYCFQHVKFEPAVGRMPVGIPENWKQALRKVVSRVPKAVIRESLAAEGPRAANYDAYCFLVQFCFLFPVAVIVDMCHIGRFTVVDYVLYRRLAEYTLDFSGADLDPWSATRMSWSPSMRLRYKEVEVPVPKNTTFVQCSDACNARIAEIVKSRAGATASLVVCNDAKHQAKLKSLLDVSGAAEVVCIDDLVGYKIPASVRVVVTSVYRGMSRVNALALLDQEYTFITVHGGALTGILYGD